MDAGIIAGLNVFRIINEQAAISLAYAYGNQFTEERYVLIFDLSGGTSNAALLIIEKRNLRKLCW